MREFAIVTIRKNYFKTVNKLVKFPSLQYKEGSFLKTVRKS
jgi:hypothetical protein